MPFKTYPPITVQIDDGPTMLFEGRNAWALRELIEAGHHGCTPIDNPAPRWSAYVHNLRRAGIEIETVHERHRGAFPGTHARYVLRSRVCVMVSKDAA